MNVIDGCSGNEEFVASLVKEVICGENSAIMGQCSFAY